MSAKMLRKCYVNMLKIFSFNAIWKVWYDRSIGMKYTHYCDIIMGAMASQITSLTIAYSTVYSDADQRKHQSSASLAFVREIHRWPVNSPRKWPVTRKMFPFDDVIMQQKHPELQFSYKYETAVIILRLSAAECGMISIENWYVVLVIWYTWPYARNCQEYTWLKHLSLADQDGGDSEGDNFDGIFLTHYALKCIFV